MSCGSVRWGSLRGAVLAFTYTHFSHTHSSLDSIQRCHFQVSCSECRAVAQAYLIWVCLLSRSLSVHGLQDPFPLGFLLLSVSDTPGLCQTHLWTTQQEPWLRVQRPQEGLAPLFTFLWKISLSQMPNQLTFNYQILIHTDSRASNKTYQSEQYKSTKALKGTVPPEIEMLHSPCPSKPLCFFLFSSILFYYFSFFSFLLLFFHFISFPSFHLFSPLFFLHSFLPSKTEVILKNVQAVLFPFWKHWNHPKCKKINCQF